MGNVVSSSHLGTRTSQLCQLILWVWFVLLHVWCYKLWVIYFYQKKFLFSQHDKLNPGGRKLSLWQIILLWASGSGFIQTHHAPSLLSHAIGKWPTWMTANTRHYTLWTVTEDNSSLATQLEPWPTLTWVSRACTSLWRPMPVWTAPPLNIQRGAFIHGAPLISL